MLRIAGGRALSITIRGLALVGLLCALGAESAFAQALMPGVSDTPVAITADAVEFDQALNVFVAKGNVRVEQQDTILTADWMALNNDTRNGLASGNVVVTENEDILYADFLQFNLSTTRGVVYDGEVEASTGFRMMGSEVRKTGQVTYEFEDPVFTTCNCPNEGREPWTVESKTATLEVEGYAVTRNTTVNVLGVPILWTPGLILPVKSDRQSGFLFPAFSNTSRRGWEIGVPFFWAAHEQVGATLTPFYSFERGFYLDAELEYLLGDEGSLDFGTLNTTFVPNDAAVEPNTANTPFDSFRWGARFRHQQFETLPWGLEAKAFVNLESDNLFNRDYDLLDEFRRDRFLMSIVSLTKNFGMSNRFGSFAAVRWADDLQAPDDQDRDDFLLQRLPEVGVSEAASFLPDALPFMDRLLTSFDVRYINFFQLEDPLDNLPTATLVNNQFLDTGIDALPDGLERNQNGDIVTLDGEIVSPYDGTVTTAQDVLDAMLAGDPEADPEQILMDIAPLFDPNQSMDNFPSAGGEGDGIFNEGEPLYDNGNRIVVNPRIAAPFRIGKYLDVYPELGYHGTFYQSKRKGFNQRQIITGRLDLRTRLEKVIDVPFLDKVQHLIEPRFTFYGVANLNDDAGNPLFIPQPAVQQTRLRQLQLDSVLRDPSDRIPTVHGFTVGVSNRMYTIEPTLEELAAAAQALDPEAEVELPDVWVPSRLYADINTSFEYRTSDQELGWFIVDGSLYPSQNSRLQLSFGWDLDQMQLAETNIAFSWGSFVGHQIRVDYRYLREIPLFFEDFRQRTDDFDENFDFEGGFTQINQIGLSTRIALTPSWGVTLAFRYSFEQGIILTNQYGLEYISKCRCWAVQLLVLNDRDQGLDWRISYSLLGLGDDRQGPGLGAF